MIRRKDVRIGTGVGAVWVGVVRCDPDGILTVPVEALIYQGNRSDIDRIGEIVDGFLAAEVIVSLPRHLKGGKGVSAKVTRKYVLRIGVLGPKIRVALIDECLTSNQAYTRLRISGISEKDHRPTINQMVVQIILEQAPEGEYMSRYVPGKKIASEGGSAQ